MSEIFTRWDAAKHLRTPEDARLYLEACVEEDPGDGSLIRAGRDDIARSRTEITEERGRLHEPGPVPRSPEPRDHDDGSRPGPDHGSWI